jgi:hypothetical protein
MMVKPPPYEPWPEVDAVKVEMAIAEGRIADAKRIAVELLRYQGDPLSIVVADLLELEKRPGKRGPKKSLPKHWLDIGIDYDMRRRRGASYDEATKELANKYH